MEPWQTKHIEAHLVDLINLTTFDTKMEAALLQEEIISKADVEALETCRKNKGESGVSKALFDILVTRRNSYKAVGKAMYQTTQTGAFLVLLMGLVTHMLQEHGIDLEGSTLEGILKSQCHGEDLLNFFLNKIDIPSLFEDSWVPPPRGGIYISRHISNRIKVNPSIFKQNGVDTFVFIGVSRPQLSKLVEPNETASSIDVILKRNTAARFVRLEHEKDWEALKSIWSEYVPQASGHRETSRSLHLIHYDKDSKEYILTVSIGPTELISKHVPPHLRNKSLYVSEEEFGSEIASSCSRDAYCICDSPGMGKTWLLQNLARGLYSDSSNRIVAFVSLSQFTQCAQLSQKKHTGNPSRIQVVLAFLCQSVLLQIILIEALKCNRIQLELFLDGFDEIAEEHLNSAKQFFKEIVESEKNVRLFVTSRPHMRKELEHTLQAVAYDIMPFSEEDQVEYHIGFWKATGDFEGKEGLLRNFAMTCLTNFKASISKKEGDLMGIPLQCYLLATVSTINAYLYCSRDGTSGVEEFLSKTSMYDMYRRYMEMGIDKATGKHNNIKKNEIGPISKNTGLFGFLSLLIWGKQGVLYGDMDRRQQLKAFHTWKALQLLHPHLAEIYTKSLNIPNRITPTEILCGILQVSTAPNAGDRDVTFLHRTFAEFLLADLFAEIFTGGFTFQTGDMLTKFVEAFFSYSTTEFTLSCINARLQHLAFVSIPKEMVINSAFNYIVYNKSCLRHAIRSSHVYIVRLIKSLLCQAFPNQTVTHDLVCPHDCYCLAGKKQNEHYSSCCYHFTDAVRYCNLEMIIELNSFYAECFGENLDETLVNSPCTKKSPLNVAVENRNYSLVEYFVGRISLPQRRLLIQCVEGTSMCTQDKVQDAVDICNLLLNSCRSLLYERDRYTSLGPLFARSVHVELLKFLVLQGADTDEVTKEGYNFFTWRLKHLSDISSNRELCRFLIFDVQAFHLFRPKLSKWRDPLLAIVRTIGTSSLGYILEVPGIIVNVLDDQDDHLIHYSIRNDKELSLVEVLIEMGADLYQKNKYGGDPLHIAAESNYKVVVTVENINKFIDYILSMRFSLEDQVDDVTTTLLLAAKNIKAAKYVVSQNADIFATDNYDNSIAHKWGGIRDFAVSWFTRGYYESLLKAKNKEGRTSLHHWITAGMRLYPDTIKKMMKFTLEDINAADNSGRTMFHSAVAQNCHRDVLNCLIQLGADPKKVDKTGQNVLHIKAQMRENRSNRGIEGVYLYKYLETLGVSPNVPDNKGDTALHIISRYSLNDVKYFMRANSDLLARNENGQNIVHVGKLCSMLCQKTVRYLLKLPDGPELFKMRDNKGKSPLQCWIEDPNKVYCLNAPIVKDILQSSRLDVNQIDDEGNTIFLSVVNAQHLFMVKCIQNLGADINAINKLGNNALHLAVHSLSRKNNAEYGMLVLKFVASIGCNANLKNNEGCTPLQLLVSMQDCNMLPKNILPQIQNMCSINEPT